MEIGAAGDVGDGLLAVFELGEDFVAVEAGSFSDSICSAVVSGRRSTRSRPNAERYRSQRSIRWRLATKA
ncbi:MAG: hypothetical protein MZU97_11430 [Bacillus subtilis]|nr:hypothetical protein [Bacillus subtilis]